MSDIIKIRPTVSQNFTGNGSNKVFTLSNTPNAIEEVKVNNAITTAYTFSGNVVTFTTAPANTVAIVITYNYWMELPTVAGKDGKTAYQAAVSAGYTGTESAFNTALASVGNKQATINVSGILKGNGSGSVTQAVSGTDYLLPSGTASKANTLANARNIIIGNATKSFNGSANITYTLDEIGAAPVSHSQAASTITAGTLGGAVVANASAVTNLNTKQVRNIHAGTTDMTAGVTPLPTGDIYIYYE